MVEILWSGVNWTAYYVIDLCGEEMCEVAEVQKSRKEGKQGLVTCVNKHSSQTSPLSLSLFLYVSIFPSLGSLHRNNSSFGSSSVDPWLTAVGLLWETGRLQRGRERWKRIWRWGGLRALEKERWRKRQGWQQASVGRETKFSPPVEGGKEWK